MKALSIRQPWAWCITAGLKPVENRSWPTRFRGEFLVHAGKKFEHDAFQWLKDNQMIPPAMELNDFPRGGLVGRANLIDCVEHMDSPWFFGDYGFVLADAQPVQFIQMPGRLGFFDVEEPPHAG